MRLALTDMCHRLGDPTLDLVVLAEGNASARASDTSFLVTGSGTALAELGASELVEVDTAAVLGLLDGDDVPLTIARQVLADTVLADTVLAGTVLAGTVLAGTAAGDASVRPSIETVLHAVLLHHTGARFVGHTHPSAVVGLASSTVAHEAFGPPLFPDEVVVCGAAYMMVPYAPPGPRLAVVLQRVLVDHLDRHGEAPRAVILANHGLLALGDTADEVVAISVMAAKAARIRAIALSVGGMVPLPHDEVMALVGREDEVERRQRLAGQDS